MEKTDSYKIVIPTFSIYFSTDFPQIFCTFAEKQETMSVIEIHSLSEEGLEPYARLTDMQLRSRQHPERGLFIAESPKVIRIALRKGYEPVSLLCEQRHLTGDARDILEVIHQRVENGELHNDKGEVISDFKVFTGERELLKSLTGYALTRGVLCAFRRKPLPSVKEVCKDARRICVIDHVVDTTNIGAIFRSAAALGIDAVLLTPGSCDPLNRRAIRVSMGNIFLVPWTWIGEGDARETDEMLGDILHPLGFKTAALALTDDSVGLEDPQLQAEERLAIILGTEGDGLPHQVIHKADYVVKIPMANGVDSLNVAAASAVAFYAL